MEYLSDKAVQKELDKEAVNKHLKSLSNDNSKRRNLCSQEKEKIREHLFSLNSEQRVVVYLYFWENLSFAEIAYVLGVPMMKAQKIFMNTLDHLRHELQDVASNYFTKIAA